MKALHFDSDHLQPADRLPMFRRGAVHFQVDPIGDPAEFRVRWRMVKLGDVNILRSRISAVRYRRDHARIIADGEDRIAIHIRVKGTATGIINGVHVAATPGSATVWDLSLPLDVGSDGSSEVLIATLPRYMLDEVLPGRSLAGHLEASPILSLAATQLRYILDEAEALPEAGAGFLGRAIRDMVAVAMAPIRAHEDSRSSRSASLMLRACDLIDAQPDRPMTEATLASALATDVADLRSSLAPVGGCAALVERRQLLAAYRLLSDPGETAQISTVARHCGFNDVSRFSRLFRTAFGVTARELRLHGQASLPPWAGAYHVERLYGPLLRSGMTE